jgi:hypothetical protein
MGEEEDKLSMFADNITLYIEKPKYSFIKKQKKTVR